MACAVGNPADRTVKKPGRAVRCFSLFIAAALSCGAGCTHPSDSIGSLDLVWGRRGISEGRFQKPRAIAIDGHDQLYIVDMTARIQVFDADGRFLRTWNTPDHTAGRPTGMNVDRDGDLLVADTHYYRLLIYSPEGKLLRTIGGERGQGPGQFGFVTDAVEDPAGNYFISEYGDSDRIQKYTHDGHFLMQWGGHGDKLGQFDRPQSIDLDDQGRVWVADAGNHRVQVFDAAGKLQFSWGHEGIAPGELSYPYGLKLDGKGHVYICEFGNSRIQKFTLDGHSIGCWGTAGREPGELFNPWGLVRDSQGRIHIVDSENHRVQRIRM
jgi:DNA-binding beta-propeller fold protein YncE